MFVLSLLVLSFNTTESVPTIFTSPIRYLYTWIIPPSPLFATLSSPSSLSFSS